MRAAPIPSPTAKVLRPDASALRQGIGNKNAEPPQFEPLMRPCALGAAPQARRGFSLVELMVVVAVLGLIVGIVTISYKNVLPRTQLNSAVRVLSDHLHGTRSEAIARNREFLFQYDLDNNTYWVLTPYWNDSEGGLSPYLVIYEEYEADLRRIHETKLPEGVSFHGIQLNDELYETGIQSVRFRPLGYSTDHRIILYQERYDRYFTVEVLSLTGLIRFHEGQNPRPILTESDFR